MPGWHKARRRLVQAAHQQRHGAQQLLGLHPLFRHGAGAFTRDEREDVQAVCVPAKEPRRALEAGILQPVQILGHGVALRLLRAADGAAHPHHAVGDVAGRQEFDVGCLTGNRDVQAALNREPTHRVHAVSVRRS